jgi:hypothetical protein
MVLRDYMKLRRRWQHLFLVVFAIALLILLTVGAYHLYDLGWNGMIREISQFVRNIGAHFSTS